MLQRFARRRAGGGRGARREAERRRHERERTRELEQQRRAREPSLRATFAMSIAAAAAIAVFRKFSTSLFTIPGPSSVAPIALSANDPIVAPATIGSKRASGHEPERDAQRSERDGRRAGRRPCPSSDMAPDVPGAHAAERREQERASVPTPCRFRSRSYRCRRRRARRRTRSCAGPRGVTSGGEHRGSRGDAGVCERVARTSASARALRRSRAASCAAVRAREAIDGEQRTSRGAVPQPPQPADSVTAMPSSAPQTAPDIDDGPGEISERRRRRRSRRPPRQRRCASASATSRRESSLTSDEPPHDRCGRGRHRQVVVEADRDRLDRRRGDGGDDRSGHDEPRDRPAESRPAAPPAQAAHRRRHRKHDERGASGHRLLAVPGDARAADLVARRWLPCRRRTRECPTRPRRCRAVPGARR